MLSVRRHRLSPALFALAGLLALAGCDRLGNPPPGGSSTDWQRWTDGTDVLRTRARSAAGRQRELLLRTLPRDGLHHADRIHGSTPAIALVTVEPTLRRERYPRLLPLVTELELDDGRIVRHTWHAPPGAGRWRALFAVPTTVRSAVTRYR